jgi:hypothetical protein
MENENKADVPRIGETHAQRFIESPLRCPFDIALSDLLSVNPTITMTMTSQGAINLPGPYSAPSYNLGYSRHHTEMALRGRVP